MIKGITMTLADGKAYVIPPLTLGALEDHQETLAQVGTELSPAVVSTLIDVALSALKRNYPGITRSDVGNLIDVENMGDVFLALMDVSGLRRKAQEEAAAKQGEA